MSISKRFTDKKINVAFYIKKVAAQGAIKIDLICEHNGWETVAMKPQKNGTFRGYITVPRFDKELYQYKYKLYFADGSEKFDNDWDAELYVKNSFGGEDSAFTTKEKDIDTSTNNNQ